ncbi:MAG: gliding motility-associated C-terminal domain-containing protein, partial [Bacteroidia bacterium]
QFAYEYSNWVQPNGILRFHQDSVSYEVTNSRSLRYWNSISNQFGELLFYVEGRKVYNYLDEVIGDIGFHVSYFDKTLIVPKPYQSNTYYVFFTGVNFGYLEVNMSENNNQGLVTSKTILIDDKTKYLYSRPIAIKKENSEEYWLLFGHHDSLVFNPILNVYSIENSRVVKHSQRLGKDFNYGDKVTYLSPYMWYETLNFSPQGNYITCNYGAGGNQKDLLIPFDKKNGEIGNIKFAFHVVDNNSSSGASPFHSKISQDETTLYISDHKSLSRNKNFELYCFDLGLDSAEVLKSKKTLLTYGKRYGIEWTPNKTLLIGEQNELLNPFANSDSLIFKSKDQWNYFRYGVPNIAYPIQYTNDSFVKFNLEVQGNCIGDETTLSLGDDVHFNSVFWKFGDGRVELTNGGEVKHKYSKSGEYFVEITVDYYDYKYTIYRKVIINGGDPLKDFEFEICKDPIQVSTDSLADSIKWQGKIVDAHFEFDLNQIGLNYVTGFYKGCSIKDSLLISKMDSLESLSITADTFCLGDFGELSINGLRENRNWTFLWSNGSSKGAILVNDTNEYSVTLNDGCYGYRHFATGAQFPVNKSFILGDSVICEPLGLKSVLRVNDSSLNFTWVGLESNKDSIIVHNEGVYILQTTDEHNCNYFDSIRITENCTAEIFIPNSFSPNNDGLNDLFFPYSQLPISYNLRIVNRWGQLIFNANTPWNGSFKGEIVPNGVYVFLLTINSGNEESFIKGNVNVIR